MKICVIGGGPSGLTCVKACKEENVDVVCYERSNYFGGLWNFGASEQNSELATVARSTIINSSKELSAFSDFVPDASLPNYFHNSLMLKYFEDYVKKFDLAKHLVYRTEVIKVKEADDYDTTGRWTVTVRNLDTNETKSEDFNSVMICTGHHGTPLWPNFKNQQKFKGKLLHSHSYKKPDGFENQSVVVCGIGNSGGDIAAELSTVTEKVYLSTRRGSWVISRMSPGGLPIDGYLIRRLNNVLLYYFPNFMSLVFETLLENRFDHKMYGLKPKHRIFQQHPTINDSLPNRILSGTVKVKGDIERFEENGVVFKGENKVTQVDSVVFATGYQINFPYLEKRLIDPKDNKIALYKYQYIPELRHPHTLAFIGLIQPYGPLIPISENQARWHLQLVKGKCKPLPSLEAMQADVAKKREALKQRYYESKRHTMQVDVVPFMDEIASQYGVKPNLVELLFTDPKLFFNLLTQQSLPYQYRLQGPHSDYEKAREAILTADQRVSGALKTNELADYSPVGFLSKVWSGLVSIFVFILLMLNR